MSDEELIEAYNIDPIKHQGELALRELRLIDKYRNDKSFMAELNRRLPKMKDKGRAKSFRILKQLISEQ